MDKIVCGTCEYGKYSKVSTWFQVFCQQYNLYRTAYNSNSVSFVLAGTPRKTDGSLPSRRPAAVSWQQASEYKIWGSVKLNYEKIP